MFVFLCLLQYPVDTSFIAYPIPFWCQSHPKMLMFHQELEEERRWEMNLEGLEEGLCDEVPRYQGCKL